MSTLKEKIFTDLKEAMKSGDTEKRDVLRMVDSMIKNTEIEKGKREEGLSDEEVVEILSRAVKQRQDSVTQYEKGGRSDLAKKELSEIEILKNYLPEQLSEDELKRIAKKILDENDLSDSADFGRAMGLVMAEVKGKADGNLVRQVVAEILK